MTVTSLDQAHTAIRTFLTGHTHVGTPAFDPMWWEDEDGFIVGVGPIEWLRDRNPQFLLIPNQAFVVDKRTGQVLPTRYFPGNPISERMDRAVRHNEGAPILL